MSKMLAFLKTGIFVQLGMEGYYLARSAVGVVRHMLFQWQGVVCRDRTGLVLDCIAVSVY